MRFTFKFRDGEVGRGLCGTCRESQIMIDGQGRETALCHSIGMSPFVVRRAIHQCSSYTAVNQMTEYEAKEIAWLLETKGKVVGFVPPKKKADNDE